ncbi:MAG: aminopeptidase P N-terminal domain-containing protein, partial [Terriglobia bacterium]
MRTRPCRLLTLLVLALLAWPLAAREKEALNEYQARRERLRARLTGPVVLVGYTGSEEISPAQSFRQEENFYYLTGHEQPGAALILVPDTEAARARGFPKEILFLPPRNKPRERWEGPKLGAGDGDAAATTGFETVLPISLLRTRVEELLEVFPNLYTLFPLSNPEHGPGGVASHAGRWLAWLRAIAPHTNFVNVRTTLGTLRQIKSESEQALLRNAIEASMAAHREAMRALRPGMYEYEIAALMAYTFTRAGCERPGYSPIVGSGFNSTVLHYDSNRRQMQAGDVVVIDVGAECAGYTADITRTLPVSGRFTPRQREIYEIVLGAQKAAIAAVKPGMTLARTGENSLYRIAYDYINSNGKDLKGEPLGKYFIHGLGHHIGLEVHDPGARALEAGMIATIEPGIYIPEENLGVRIEDIVLVTETGAELLTASLPRTV